MTAGIKGADLLNRRLRIATKYVNVARAYFLASQGQQADIIKLYGFYGAGAFSGSLRLNCRRSRQMAIPYVLMA